MAWYNFSWRGSARGLKRQDSGSGVSSLRQKNHQEEIDHLLVIEERRKVSRENTISLYGRAYPTPKGYIGARDLGED